MRVFFITVTMDVLAKTKIYLSPFVANANTGNVYEIYVALSMFRKMGLTNEHLQELAPLIAQIEALGHGNEGLSTYVEKVKASPVVCTPGITDIENSTQEDGVGTADLFQVRDDGIKFGFSVTEGSGAITPRSGLSKVITNAGCTRLGCSPEDIEAIIGLERGLTQKDKDDYCATTYGEDKSKWPKKCKFPAGIQAQSDVAAILAARLNSLPDAERRAIMNDVLCIGTKPADYFAFVNKKTGAITYYRIGAPIIDKDTWIPRIVSNGVYLDTYHEDVIISKSQVKYNNGVGTSMRKVNIGARLDKIFNLTAIQTPM